VSPNFTATTESHDGIEIVSVSGELDQATAPELREALEAAIDTPGSPVLANLTDCGFIDSTGLSLLVEVQRRLAEDSRPFAVCCAHGDVTRLLELTGIDAAVTLFETRDEAIAALARTRTAD
jgi:anti-sigma B factor antagonist